MSAISEMFGVVATPHQPRKDEYEPAMQKLDDLIQWAEAFQFPLLAHELRGAREILNLFVTDHAFWKAVRLHPVK